VLRRLLAMPGEQLWWIALAALCAAVTAAAGMGLVAVAAHLISRAALVSTTAVLALAITGVRAFAVTRVVSRYLERLVGHHATFRILTATRVAVFRRLVPLAPGRLVARRDGELLSHLTADVDTVAELALRVIVPVVAAVATVTVAAVVVGVQSPWSAAVVVAFLLTATVVVPSLARRSSRCATSASATARRELSATAVEALRGIDELVAWDRPDLLVGAVHTHADAAGHADRRLARYRGAVTGLGALASLGCVVVVLVVAVPLVRAGTMDGVHLAAVALTALAAFEVVPAIDAAWQHLERALDAGGRVLSLVDTPAPVADPEPGVAPPTGTIDLDLRSVGVAAGPTASATVDAHIAWGATAVVNGPSGAGKSSLLAALQRFGEHQGELLVGGVSLADLTGADARSLVAAVTQQDHLFDTSVRDNLLLADPDASDDLLWSALEAVGAGDLVRSLPGALSARSGPDGADLSGGERQRVLIARALLADRPLLVLDEATAHLDPRSAASVLRAARRWHDGTLVVITHQPELVEAPDVRIEILAGPRGPSTASGASGPGITDRVVPGSNPS
jgi:thiol reductant ABC exporter CydC subunit